MDINEICLKYKTDKSSNFHNYSEKYEQYFSKLKNEKIKILEIGIQNGYSLKTWCEYFPNAEVYGVDIVNCSHLDNDRIKTFICNQTDLDMLNTINENYGPFDIIIDDGSHVSNHMVTTFNHLFPLLKPNGLYIVEDLHCCYWSNFSSETKFMDRMKELLDVVNGNGKCGLAEIKNLDSDNYYQNKTRGEMDWWEMNIEFLHLYRSIVFIKKR
jgi:hypothetical protein